MTLDRRHLVALIGAALTSSIALDDAITQGLTGRSSVFASDSGSPGWIVAGDLVHGLTYAALARVLLAERARFAATNRLSRVLRRVLIATFAVMAVVFVVIEPIKTLAGISADAPALMIFDLVGTAIFAIMILGSLQLGLALLRTHTLGIGARVLAALTPMLLLSVGLVFVAPEWTHPGYLETLINVGIALLGVGAAAPQPIVGTAASEASSSVVNSASSVSVSDTEPAR